MFEFRPFYPPFNSNITSWPSLNPSGKIPPFEPSFVTQLMSESCVNPGEIRLRQTRIDLETSQPHQDEVLSLADKIEEYALRLGFSNAYTAGILSQLLVSGKVRVDFRDHSERLELLRKEDSMQKTEAVALIEQVITQLRKARGHATVDDSDDTQRILVQPPKPQRPSQS
jgi:hypothetical protein